MPTKQQIIKNLRLSEKLLSYLSENPQKNNSEAVSYIIVTKEDKELSKLNLSLAGQLIKEGKQVIKAEETKSKSNPWVFTHI